MLDAPESAVLAVNLGTPEAPTAPAVRRYLETYLGKYRAALGDDLIGQRGLNPAVGGAAAKEFVDFGKDHGAHGKRCSSEGRRLYRPARRPPVTPLICIKSPIAAQQL